MRDIVLSESSHYWKIRVPPTRFHGYFCEPVTREFVSDPELCSNREHLWKCSFTENMINGVATIDIVIQRIEIKPGEGGGESEGEGDDESASGGSGGEPSSSSFFTLQKEQQQQQHNQGQRQQQEEQEQEQQKEQEQPCISESDRPANIHYKTIALHTPKTLAPLMSMFLDGALSAETPIRVELEADAIRHKGNYEFEIVLSEDISSYMNPSPSSCHRVFDSLYHEMVATSHPDTSTADIWFEFYPHSSSSPQEPTLLPSMLLLAEERHHHLEARQHQYQEQHAEHHDGSAVAVVGAHWEKLKGYPYFADWIQREKQLQEEERRRQLEEEWRIHQEHNQHRQQQEHRFQKQQQYQQQQQHSQSPPYSSWWHTEPPEYQMGDFDGPQQQQRHTQIEQALSHGSLRYGEQQQHHYQYPQQHPLPFQRSEYHPREVPIYFRPLQGPAASLSSPSYPFLEHKGPSSSHPRYHHHPTATTRPEPSQSHQHRRQVNSPPLPFPPAALRIPVNNKDVSLGTFQVILQYIYTGSIGLSEGQIHDIDKYWNHYPEEQITPQGDKNLLDDEDMPPLSSLLAYFHARERAEKLRSDGDSGSGGARIEPRPPILLPPPGRGFVDERSNEGSNAGSGALEDRRRPFSTIKDLLTAGDMYTFTTASMQTAWIPCSPRNRRKEFRDPQPSPALASHHEEPARGGEEEEGEEGQTGGHDSDSGQSGHRQDQGQGGCRSGGNRGGTGQHGASVGSGSGRGEATSSISNPEGDSPLLATTTTDTLPRPPNRHPLIHHIRPTCSWESLLLAANLFRLHDLETTALKAIKYHCQMLASRAMINNNVMAEVAHNGFDRSNLDLQLALGERIMLSLLKLYRSSGLRFHPEGVQVVHGGGGEGGGEGGIESAQREPFAIQSRLEERFRHQREDQQEEHGKEKEKRDDDDDDERQEEGRLGTIRSSSSSSSAARTHGSSSGGAGSRRHSAHRQSRVGHQAPQGEGFIAIASSGGSSGSRGGRSRSTLGPFRAGSRGSPAERAEEKEEQRGVEQEEEREGGEEEEEGGGKGNEGGKEEDMIASPLELFNHPECENVLEVLCKDLRERFMSMREVMDHRHRQGGNRAA